MYEQVFDVADYKTAKKSVFLTSGLLLFLGNVSSIEDSDTSFIKTLDILRQTATEPLQIILAVLVVFLIIRSFEVRLPIRKIIPEFIVGLTGAIVFAIFAIATA